MQRTRGRQTLASTRIREFLTRILATEQASKEKGQPQPERCGAPRCSLLIHMCPRPGSQSEMPSPCWRWGARRDLCHHSWCRFELALLFPINLLSFFFLVQNLWLKCVTLLIIPPSPSLCCSSDLSPRGLLVKCCRNACEDRTAGGGFPRVIYFCLVWDTQFQQGAMLAIS